MQLQNIDTQKVVQTKVLDISLIQKTKVSQDNGLVITDTGGATYTKAVDDILSYYVLVKNAYKLGIPDLYPSETERLNNLGYPNQVSKLFKIKVKEERVKSGFREISIRVPSRIGVWEFYWWVEAHVPTAIETISPSGRRHSLYRRG